MYKLIIADDEPRIRTLLQRIVDWKSLGFEIVKVFSDGSEVIKYLEHNRVDCVLCDICMKHISGIEIAEYVYNNFPQINIMFLSGYQDFNYATAALKFGVENYFLKPVQIDEIKNAFKSLKNKLDDAKSNSELLSYYRRDMLNNLANGFYTDSESINKVFNRIQLNINSKYSCALLTIIFASPIKTDSEALMNLFQNLVSLKQSDIFAFYLICDYTSVKYIMFSELFSESAFLTYANNLCTDITEISGISTKISDFSCHKSVFHFCKNFNNLLDVNETVHSKKIEQLLVLAVNSGNTDEVAEILLTISDYVASFSFSKVKQYFNTLLKNIKPDLLTIVVDGTDSDKNNDLFASYSNAIDIYNTLEEIYAFVNDFFIKLARVMKDTNIQKKNILRIRNYISQHYTEDLSLESLSSMAYLSPTYFSKVFKDIVGQNYIEFLTSCKINKAKDLLLNTNLKIYEISNAVGYRNIRSFTKFFKSNCGISPSEYRNKFSGGITNV